MSVHTHKYICPYIHPNIFVRTYTYLSAHTYVSGCCTCSSSRTSGTSQDVWSACSPINTNEYKSQVQMNTNLNEYKFQDVWSAHSPREPVCLPTYLRICMHLQTNIYICAYMYGVAMISRLLKIIGLFCRISSLS